MSNSRECPREEEERLELEFIRNGTRSTDPRAVARVYRLAPDPYRTQFERDYTRIIHSRAFRRLRHKTQVFVHPRNDHICTRLEHSLIVASVARTISKALSFNNELTAAIAAGHDLGHAPFGHEGEQCLGGCWPGHGFHHELHGLRVVDRVERMYDEHAGLNLTFAVRDGIACHCGEAPGNVIKPNLAKKIEDLGSVARADAPATIEGCAVRFADKIAYIGRDLEDAISIDIIKRQSIPAEVRGVLGTNNNEIMGRLIGDVIANSSADHVGLSQEIGAALEALLAFNNRAIYQSERVRDRFQQIDKAFTLMFGELVAIIRGAQEGGDEDPLVGRKEESVQVLRDFLVHDIRDWRTEVPEQLCIDFIAGMTDSFFIIMFQDLFLPRPFSDLIAPRDDIRPAFPIHPRTASV